MILIHILRLCGRCASRSVCFRSFSDFFSVSLYLFCLDSEVVRLCGRFAAGFHLFCGCFESFVVLCFLVVFLHFLCLSFGVVFHLFVAIFCLLKLALYLRLAVLHSSVLSVVVLCFLFFRISYTLLLVAVLSLLAVVLCLVELFSSRLVILLLFEAILHRRRSFCTSFVTILQFSLHLLVVWLTFPTGNVEPGPASSRQFLLFRLFDFFRPHELYSLQHRQVNNLS